MTPQEKAKELLEKMNVIHYLKGNGLPVSMHKSQVKKCALIAVDEIEEALTDYGRGYSFQLQNMDSEFRFWENVKQEIENL
jgi:hypothetical protein